MHPLVHSQVDLETTGIKGVGTVTAFDLLTSHLEEIGAVFYPLPVQRHTQRQRDRLLVGCGIDESELQHPRQDLVPPVDRVLGPFDRIVLVIGTRDHPRQQRRLGKAEVHRRLFEIELGGRFHTVRTVAEEDLVGVHGEDLILRVAFLDVEGE